MLPKFSSIVDLGIGLFKQTEENFQSSIHMIEKRISDLKDLGEREKTEMLLQIEELLKKGIRDSRKIETDLHNFFNNFFSTEKTNEIISQKPKIIQNTKLKKTKKVKAA